jgi:hypothetical protein
MARIQPIAQPDKTQVCEVSIRSGGRLNENQYSGGDKQKRGIALVTVCGEAFMKKAQQIAVRTARGAARE